MTAFKKGYIPWNAGRTYLEMYGAKRAVEVVKRFQKSMATRPIDPIRREQVSQRLSAARKIFYEDLANRPFGSRNGFYGRKHTEETKRLIAVKAHLLENRLKKDNPLYFQNKAKAGAASYLARREKNTDIERMVERILLDNDFCFQAQVQIGWYIVDFLISEKIVVEASGRYWHRNRPKDMARRKYLEGLGYTVFEYFDTTIKRRGFEGKIVEHLRSALQPVTNEG